MVLFGFLAPGGAATFRLSGTGEAVQLPPLTVPAAAAGWIVAILLIAGAVYAWTNLRGSRTNPGWLPLGVGTLFLAGFLVWVTASANNPNISLITLLSGSLALALPMVFGSMSGVLCERSGVVNIAIEGQLLLGAFSAAVGGSLTGSVWGAMISAAVGGVVVSALLALFAVKYLVNQIIVGVVLNVLVAGLTGFLFGTLLAPNSQLLNSPPRLTPLAIPLLSDIPLLGPLLFRQTPLGYIMFATVALLWFALYKTRWGLRIRAVGEHPKAADTVGIKVNRTRVLNVLLGGAIAGLGGSYYTLVSVSQFAREMTAGAGFIALAALIFGRWNPIGAFFASLLFGFATNLQYVLAQAGTDVPSQFMAMLPYLVTILAVAGLVGRSRPPAASGIPYVKE
ncbi:ABC transporter permease [Zafaria sp. J156]|nr:ABC transporter permease [Zafaria sp. J156]MEE1619900.1 ABC transporter permease [Zafaria sp. J156]